MEHTADSLVFRWVGKNSLLIWTIILAQPILYEKVSIKNPRKGTTFTVKVSTLLLECKKNQMATLRVDTEPLVCKKKDFRLAKSTN